MYEEAIQSGNTVTFGGVVFTRKSWNVFWKHLSPPCRACPEYSLWVRLVPQVYHADGLAKARALSEVIRNGKYKEQLQ